MKAASHPNQEVMDVKRLFIFILIVALLPIPAKAIRWVDFKVPYETLKYAMDLDIKSAAQENHISWIELLAADACENGGRCPLSSVKKTAKELMDGKAPQEFLGQTFQYYDYYHESFDAVLGGMLGNFSVEIDGQEKHIYGLKAFSPIAQGYGYSHCSDFGNARGYGFKRKHLGNDLMGSQGTPIVAVEGGVVEALGWNQYGGWRVGIRSFDSKRYYYYAHLQKDAPFAPGLAEGDMVQPGDLIGFMGRTGYSLKENTNNIETVHLHFGMQLVFDESQKECLSEIWIDVYDIVRLLDSHRSSLVKDGQNWKRKYPFVDYDVNRYPLSA